MLFVVEGSRDSTGFSPRRIALFLATVTSRTVYPRKYAGRRVTSAKCNSGFCVPGLGALLSLYYSSEGQASFLG